jgi:hypothetical protein
MRTAIVNGNGGFAASQSTAIPATAGRCSSPPRREGRPLALPNAVKAAARGAFLLDAQTPR